MDLDMDVSEFFQILAEPPASPSQEKARQEEINEEQQLNIGTPSMGLDSSNFHINYDPYPHKEHGVQGTDEILLSEMPDIFQPENLNPNSCESLQSEQLRGTTPSSSSDIFQELESVSGLDELGTMYPVDSERPQQRDGSVLASDWMPPTNMGNNTVTHAFTVNSLDAERNHQKSGFIDDELPLVNAKLSANNVNESISGQSFQVSAARELVDLTQTDSSDDEVEITLNQFGHTSKPDSVNADARRKLPSWGKLSNKNSVKKGSWKIPQKYSNLSDSSSRKVRTNADERRLVGLQLQESSGTALGGKFTEKKQNTGNSYQHSEFSVEQKPQVKEEWMGLSFEQKLPVREEWMCGSFEHNPQIKEEWNSGSFEQKPQIKEEWSGGCFPFPWKSNSVNLDEEVIEKPNLNDIKYWNGDSDTEDKPDYNNTVRHLPPTLVCGRSSNAAGPHVPSGPKDDEAVTFRAVLQYQDLPTVETRPDDGLMSVPLLKHQRIALAWMVLQETKSMHCAGGILADDQGLGKTVSVIALILKERPPNRSLQEDSNQVKVETSAVNLDEDDVVSTSLERKTSNNDANDIALEEYIKGKENTFSMKKGRPSAGTLVVCPTSVLKQWAQEIRDKVTAKANLSVLVYHGSNRTKDPDELARHDVVLTTYSIVSMEVPKQDLGDDYEEVERNPDDSGLIDSFILKKKKKMSETVKKTKSRKGENGSSSEPIPRPLARVGWFRVVLDEAQSIKNHRTQVARACWGLRAKRRWCLSGTPIQNSIDDLFSYFRFLKYDPYAIYKSFTSKIKLPISRNPISGYQKLQAVLKTVMLRRTKGTTIDGEPIITLPPKTVTLQKVEFSAEERDFYHLLEVHSQAQFKVYAAAGTVKKNYVNILLMLLRLRQACDHPLLAKSCLSISNWRSSAEAARKLPREKQIDLINRLEGSLALCGLCNDAPEEAVVTICGHVFCNQCILDHLTQSDDSICPTQGCKRHLKDDSVFSLTALKHCTSDDIVNDEISASLGGVSELDLKFDNPDFHSSKIKAAMETLQALPKFCTSASSNSYVNNINKDSAEMSDSDNSNQQAEPSLKKQIIETSEKAIVFSQWTSMLDLLEVPLKKSCIQYRRLDGTMSVIARDKAVNDFKTLPEVTVMIMSLKAASLGLNMVAASHVLLLDLWWNPTTEDQAIDRAHRIGQMRPVKVSRFTVKDTVEDRILALQDRKREMVASAFGEDGAGGRQTRLTEEDLRYLFMV